MHNIKGENERHKVGLQSQGTWIRCSFFSFDCVTLQQPTPVCTAQSPFPFSFMADIPTISITNPDLECQEWSMTSPAPSRPGSPTVFDVVNSMEALDRDAMVEMSPDNVSTTSTNSDTIDQVVDDDDHEARPMSPPPPPIKENVHDFYRDKTVFLTGATGFLGKALLWKLLMLDVKKVFVLVRPSSTSTNASDRFYDEIMSNKASQKIESR